MNNDQLINATFELKDQTIVLYTNEKHIQLPAYEIYNVVFKNHSIISNKYRIEESIDKTFKNIRFSKNPKDLALGIVINNKGKLEVSFVIKECNVKITHLPLEEVQDHKIINKTWYPFVRDKLEYLSTLLTDQGITSLGVTTINQYLSIKSKIGENYDLLIEEITSKSIGELSREEIKDIPPAFKGKLYDYQKTGLNWLYKMSAEGIGGILADEMGLGKTIQILALLVINKSKELPSLIVVRATLIENWKREVFKFTEGLKLLVHHGPDRTGIPRVLKMYDLVITSYDVIIRDASMLKMVNWNLVILDEAQDIKNPDSQRSQMVKQLPKKASFAVTGTPVENRLLDIWSIMNFTTPEYLCSQKRFIELYENEFDGTDRLEPIIRPLMLRRTIKDVSLDLPLPDRIDIPQFLAMDNYSAVLYEQYRKELADKYRNGGHFASLIKLRQFCCHHDLIYEPSGYTDPADTSVKYQRLMEILNEFFWANEKAIIFTSFKKMVNILMQDIKARFDVFSDKIDGSIMLDERLLKIDRFSDTSEPGVLILNPKAAGTGLNITAANHVIHYNPEWNPATEDQATGRAHRFGQEKPVTVHKLLYADTVEEVMQDRLERKRRLSDETVIGTTGKEEDLRDVLRSLSMSPVK